MSLTGHRQCQSFECRSDMLTAILEGLNLMNGTRINLFNDIILSFENNFARG